MSDYKSSWAHCNRCNKLTCHSVLFEKTLSTDTGDDEHPMTEWDSYSLLTCDGCNTGHLKYDSAFSEVTDAEGDPEVTTVHYPPRMSRAVPDWLTDWRGPFWSADNQIKPLLQEIYAAMHNGSLRLAAMGIRALIEQIMIEKVGDKGNFESNIRAFFDAGFVAPVSQKAFRENLIEAGHAAMHRSYKPDIVDLQTLLDIAEGLIASIYVHQQRAEGMSARIPKRQTEK